MQAPGADALRELEGSEPQAASLWHEARADALDGPDDAEQRRFALAAAARHATGIRRVTLLRRLADAQLLAGQPDAAIITLQPVGRALSAQPLAPTAETEKALAALRPRSAEDDWLTLSAPAALAGVELTRAEALSHLIKRDDAVAGFADVERRLQRLEGHAASQLWIRWARAQSWFLCEILGDAGAALQICARVRQKLPSDALRDGAQAIALLRAEEVASTSAGDFARGRALVEEQIALAQQQQAPREECLAWNARAILTTAKASCRRRAPPTSAPSRWRCRPGGCAAKRSARTTWRCCAPSSSSSTPPSVSSAATSRSLRRLATPRAPPKPRWCWARSSWPAATRPPPRATSPRRAALPSRAAG
ncbi:MAG: hypothetical protein IPJ65_01470 [Archangiaceae bacterium]|nr:hypothetical protein [Archangiaceae bacterium]